MRNWELQLCCRSPSGDFRNLDATRKSSSDPLWSGETPSHNRVLIQQRTDRDLLLSIYEQSRHILQVKMSLFGDLPGVQPCVVPTSTPALQKALAFMSGLAKRYCDGEIEDAPALKKERNRLLESMGLARSKTTTTETSDEVGFATSPHVGVFGIGSGSCRVDRGNCSARDSNEDPARVL